MVCCKLYNVFMGYEKSPVVVVVVVNALVTVVVSW